MVFAAQSLFRETMPTCSECEADECESRGRWLILPDEHNNLEWSFQCLACIRAWRGRALVRQGLSQDKILAQLNQEYPLDLPDPHHEKNS